MLDQYKCSKSNFAYQILYFYIFRIIEIAIKTFKNLLFIIQMEEDRKKRELRAQELDVKGDEGILQFYTQFCGTNCIIV